MFVTFKSPGYLLDILEGHESQTPHWLLLVADTHADQLPSLLKEAKQRGIELHGGIFPGLIDATECRDHGVIIIPLPAQAEIVSATLGSDSIEWRRPLPHDTQTGFGSALIFLDCLSPNVIRFLDEVYDAYSTTISYAGAGSGFHDLRNELTLFSANQMIRHGALVILFPQPSSTTVKHGFSRIAGPYIATSVAGNIIRELNWEPAGTFYRNEVEKLKPALQDKPVFPHIISTHPLSIGKQSAEDVVRDPIQINDANEIILLSEVTENSAMYIVEGDKASLIGAARLAAEECRTDTAFSHCFVSDCYSRAIMLKDDLQQELSEVEEALQQYTNIRVEGVLALGEICGNERSSLSFYNKTFVISLLHVSS
jgi:hypothetical protein